MFCYERVRLLLVASRPPLRAYGISRRCSLCRAPGVPHTRHRSVSPTRLASQPPHQDRPVLGARLFSRFSLRVGTSTKRVAITHLPGIANLLAGRAFSAYFAGSPAWLLLASVVSVEGKLRHRCLDIVWHGINTPKIYLPRTPVPSARRARALRPFSVSSATFCRPPR